MCRRAQRYCYVYPLRRNQDPVPRLLYCFLTASPLSLHPLPSLISNGLYLPFGTQGRSWKLKTKKETGDTERLPCPGAPQGPAWFHFQTEHHSGVRCRTFRFPPNLTNGPEMNSPSATEKGGARMYPTMLPNSGSDAHCWQAGTQEDECWLERKSCFVQEAGNVGRKWTHVQKQTPNILLNHESF